jgi:hypothetical protein
MSMSQGLGSGNGLTPEKEAAIRRAAAEEGVSPAYMLAVAERESSFNTRDHASKTIFGAFQMTGGLRQKYGGADADTDDIYKQAKMFGRYTKEEVEPPMRKILGRDPTPEETYTGHHFGPGRAARMLSTVDAGTPVSSIFTPYELSLNPHIVRAGTSGNLVGRTLADMSGRMGKYDTDGAEDFAKYGIAAGGMPAPPDTDRGRRSEHDMLYGDPQADFAQYGIAGGAPSAVDFAKYGVAGGGAVSSQQAPAQQTAQAEPQQVGITIPSLVRGVKNWWDNLPTPPPEKNTAPPNPWVQALEKGTDYI